MNETTATDRDLDQVVADDVDEALAHRSAEGTGAVRLTMADIPPELAEESGLDMFPPELQEEILTLATHMTDYFLDELATADREGPPQGFMSRAWDCYQRVPYKDIMRDHQRNVLQTHRPPGAMGRMQPYIAPAVSIGTTFGSLAGHMYGCMTNRPPSMRR